MRWFLILLYQRCETLRPNEEPLYVGLMQEDQWIDALFRPVGGVMMLEYHLGGNTDEVEAVGEIMEWMFCPVELDEL